MYSTLKTLFGFVTLAAALTVVDSPAAQATGRELASGEFVVEALVPTSVEPKGEITHIELTAAFRLEGTFDGIFIADFHIVHLGPFEEFAQEYFIAHGTFAGEVDGTAGSFDFVFVGEIDAEGLAEGTLVIGPGTDELTHLSGQITLSGLAGVAGSYEGHIHFAP